MNQTNNNVKLVGALFLGAIIGSALGILFAPGKGSETRKKIRAQSDDLTEGLKEKFQDFLAEVKSDMEIVKEKTHAFMGDGIAKAENFETN